MCGINKRREVIALDRQGTQQQRPQSTLGGVYIPCIYSHARWSYRKRLRSLLLCPLSVELYYFPLFVVCYCATVVVSMARGLLSTAVSVHVPITYSSGTPAVLCASERSTQRNNNGNNNNNNNNNNSSGNRRWSNRCILSTIVFNKTSYIWCFIIARAVPRLGDGESYRPLNYCIPERSASSTARKGRNVLRLTSRIEQGRQH